VKAVPIATRNEIAPVTQVPPRPPRHAPMKNLPHKWITITKKNSSTDQRWMLLKKSPTPVVCHQLGPLRPSTMPELTTTTSAAIVSTPKT
jgi:hypothetical protein